MKTIITLALSFVLATSIQAQTTSTVTLLEDQNPNFQKSRDKYMKQAEELTKNEGQTIQQTYKAIDDVQAKKERKELALERRHERRMARIQSRGIGRSRYYNDWGYGYGNYNSYGNYGNYNSYGNYGYNPYYGYNRQPWGHPGFSSNIYGNVNSTINTALLGLTLWSILRR